MKNVLMASDGILRAVHFIDRTEEHNFLKYTEDVAADGDGIDDLEYDNSSTTSSTSCMTFTMVTKWTVRVGWSMRHGDGLKR